MRQKRRGPRMNSRVAQVVIESKNPDGPISYDAGFTRVINDHGCLLVSPKELNVQQQLRLTNLFTRQTVDGVVVWKGTQRPDGWDMGVEIVAPDSSFWGLEL